MTIPLPTSSPSQTTSTASPASNSPSTPMIPTGQQARAPLAQHPRGAGVDRHPAPGWLRVAQPELERRHPLGVRREPRARPRSPAAAASSVPLAVPSQITAGIPAALAISAAATLLRIPPEPNGEVRSPIS